MSTSDLNRIMVQLRDLLPELVSRYQIESLGVFGSYVRQEQHTGSDLDLLVAYKEPPSLFLFIDMKEFLTERLGMKVDLVMKDALKPRLEKAILQEVVPV